MSPFSGHGTIGTLGDLGRCGHLNNVKKGLAPHALPTWENELCLLQHRKDKFQRSGKLPALKIKVFT